MKVRELCYSGTLQNMPMQLTRGFMALPAVNDTYVDQGKIKQLSDTNFSHLKQMYSNYYIQREEWHELIHSRFILSIVTFTWKFLMLKFTFDPDIC